MRLRAPHTLFGSQVAAAAARHRRDAEIVRLRGLGISRAACEHAVDEKLSCHPSHTGTFDAEHDGTEAK